MLSTIAEMTIAPILTCLTPIALLAALVAVGSEPASLTPIETVTNTVCANPARSNAVAPSTQRTELPWSNPPSLIPTIELINTRANGRVKGRVTDEFGQPVNGTEIYIKDLQIMIQTITKSIDGRFDIEATPGRHEITCRGEHVPPEPMTVMVTSNLTTEVHLCIQRGNRVRLIAVDEAGDPVQDVHVKLYGTQPAHTSRDQALPASSFGSVHHLGSPRRFISLPLSRNVVPTPDFLSGLTAFGVINFDQRQSQWEGGGWPASSYTFVAGHDKFTRSAPVVVNTHAPLTIVRLVLRRPCKARVRVVKADGSGVANRSVGVEGPMGPERMMHFVRTKNDGTIDANWLVPGTHRVWLRTEDDANPSVIAVTRVTGRIVFSKMAVSLHARGPGAQLWPTLDLTTFTAPKSSPISLAANPSQPGQTWIELSVSGRGYQDRATSFSISSMPMPQPGAFERHSIEQWFDLLPGGDVEVILLDRK